MLAFLRLISIRDYLYGTVIVGLMIAFGICRHDHKVVEHIDQLGHAAEQVVKADDTTAKQTETQSALIYKEIVRIPAVPDVGIVCSNTGSGALPAPDTKSGTPVGKPATDSGVGPRYDPSGAALTRARAADAQIAYLQRRVKELEAQMNAAP